MAEELFEIPTILEVHPLGENGEMEILPASDKNLLSTSKLPCGLPPILPDMTTTLESFLKDPEKLPILHLDAVQRLVPIRPNIRSLYSVDLCPLQTTLTVKRDMMTGKLLGFREEAITEGTHKTSTSLSRVPGPPEAGVRGSTTSLPFWPGGMNEPWIDLLKKENVNTSLFDGELLDTPPGFESGMSFEKKPTDEIDYCQTAPQTIFLSDVLATDDSIDFEILKDSEEFEDEVDLEKAQMPPESSEEDKILPKFTELPVLKISETVIKKVMPKYEWAVIEDATKPVEDFDEKIPQMAYEYKFELDIFQKRAVLHLEKHESVFVAAHTSAGKTVVAEYAIALAEKNMTKVIYTSPIKALSNQKYRDFKKSFGDVGLITGDIQKNDKASCLIMTTEILRSMLYHGSDTIRELEWVIFDEVHYINDSERGVVWEEVFIMLPDHVNLIMLSATVPNTAEFAEWLGGIKKRKIYVISTLKRPVPLEYFLYTGSIGIFQDDMFPIVDKNGKFLHDKYAVACRKKGERENKSKAVGPKGPRYIINAAQEKNSYLGLLGYLEKKDLLPAVCFTFSRKKCNSHAAMLHFKDLTTGEEKHKIVSFFSRSMASLNKDDKELPQIKLMEEQLKRGFGIHHSGILPLLKEVVEMLFQEGLVKVLFATETFAMGVNMPTRTVVFDSVRKHDGTEFRDLQPSEFIQMAGRAGRRGKDDTGTVIVLCKGDIPDITCLERIMKGKPTMLKSQFKLTYTMILNLLKIKTLRVEDVMRCSFGESENQKERQRFKGLLNDSMQKMTDMKKPECSLCDKDLSQYITCYNEISRISPDIRETKGNQAIFNKILVPGRVVVLSTSTQQNIPGVVLNVDKQKKCSILVITDKWSQLGAQAAVATNVTPFSKKLFYPTDRQPKVMDVLLQDIKVISNKSLKIDIDDVIKEGRKMGMLKCSPGFAISAAFQKLCNLCEANLNGFSSANINHKDMELADKCLHLERLENSLDSFTCINCPLFEEHFAEVFAYVKLQEEIKEYKFNISEESLALHPEFENRKQVLKELMYIDKREDIQLKGSVAREMSSHELFITELLIRYVINDCKPEEIAALLSCMVFQQKSTNAKLDLPSEMLKKVEEMKEVALDIANIQAACGIQEPNFVDQYNFELVPVVYDWAMGTTFAQIMVKTEVDEGIIVRCIQRLSELLKDVRTAANLVGDPILGKKMEKASELIKRDIVFAASLYTQDEKRAQT